MIREIKDHSIGLKIMLFCLMLVIGPAVHATEANKPTPGQVVSSPVDVSESQSSHVRVIPAEKGLTGLDLTHIIGSDIWEPRSCRAENGDYYVAVQAAENFPFTNIQLHVYKSTGDPHQYPWEYVIGIENSGYDLYNQDIEIVSSADRGFLFYSDEEQNWVKCFWWVLSDPSQYGTWAVGFLTFPDYSLAITSDEVSFNGDAVWLYATWVENELVKFSRSTDLGLSWENSVVVAIPWVPPTSAMGGGDLGQGITFCPGNQKVLITYIAPVDSLTQSIFVAYSDGEFGSGTWGSTELTEQGNISAHDIGITSMFGNYVLLSWRYLGTLRYMYSTNGASSWSSVYDFNLVNLDGAACASNNDGYFSIFYSSLTSGLKSFMTDYTGLNSTASWTEMVIDSIYHDIDCFANISDGQNPDHGGVWSYAQQESFFGWGGEPELAVDTTGLFFQWQEGTVPPAPQPIVITNNGTCGLGWDAESDSPWITLDPTSGSDVRPGGTDTVWVSITPDWPGAGYYFGEVTVNSPGAGGSPGVVDVELQCFGDVLITLTPLNPPIVIPETGGSFDFNLSIENFSMDPQTFDLWTQIRLPGYGTVPLIQINDVNFPAGGQRDRNLTQNVPAFAPPGEYTYWGFIGDHPWIIEGASAFTFIKTGTDASGSLGDPSDWSFSGEQTME
jgi:hypothetical protein